MKVDDDQANAFNSVARALLRLLCERLSPELLPTFDTLYELSSELLMADGSVIWSHTGVRQGCGLSGSFYCLLSLLYHVAINDECQRTPGARLDLRRHCGGWQHGSSTGFYTSDEQAGTRHWSGPEC